VLVVLDREQEDAARAFRNLPKVHLILPSELNAYDVLCCDWVVFTRDNLPAGSDRPDTTHVADAPAPAADAEEVAV
jgi:large subunit ribosomal protein L4